MPIGACDRCHCWFVVEDERSPQRTCPRCFHPMRMVANAEALDRLHRPAGPPAPAPRAGGDPACPSSAALAASELGQRLLIALAEAAAICSEAETRRQEARALRRRLAQARQEVPAAAKPPPLPAGEEELDAAA